MNDIDKLGLQLTNAVKVGDSERAVGAAVLLVGMFMRDVSRIAASLEQISMNTQNRRN